jgi:hypothetical protein
MTRNGRPSGAASGDAGGEVPQIAARIKGPIHSRQTRAIGETDTVDTFFVYFVGAEETDSFQWVGPAYSDGTDYVIPDQAVYFTTPTAATTMMEVTYLNVLSAGSVNFGCFVNGYFFYGNVEIGSAYGGDYP